MVQVTGMLADLFKNVKIRSDTSIIKKQVDLAFFTLTSKKTREFKPASCTI